MSSCGVTVVRVFQLTFARHPTAQEVQAALTLANQHGLAALCRALLNSNELIYVD